jgi:hypothetical protein
MIARLVIIFLYTYCIWLATCSISWFGGGYIYAIFNGFNYSAGLSDAINVMRLAFVISSTFTVITWVKIRNLH